jgi:hypothetical protein
VAQQFGVGFRFHFQLIAPAKQKIAQEKFRKESGSKAAGFAAFRHGFVTKSGLTWRRKCSR